jgi:sn-glycerol 3-phosphate transport system permease protein
MVENRRWLTWFAYAVLAGGIVVTLLPIWITFVASTHPQSRLLTGLVPIWPGSHALENYGKILGQGNASAGGGPVAQMMLNSLIMALSITIGKIAISIISAFAIVYFRFPLRMACFWVIFLTLMLPVEVRILPTYKVVADLGMLNSYAGLSIPLIASATATFLFRQFFMTVPDELVEAARIDGAGPMKFFRDILLPLSRTNIAALFVILFIFGWNQYLWPLLITTETRFNTVVMGIQRLVAVADTAPVWNEVMAMAMLGMLPPVLVVLVMQRLFVKGLVETEK